MSILPASFGSRRSSEEEDAPPRAPDEATDNVFSLIPPRAETFERPRFERPYGLHQPLDPDHVKLDALYSRLTDAATDTTTRKEPDFGDLALNARAFDARAEGDTTDRQPSGDRRWADAFDPSPVDTSIFDTSIFDPSAFNSAADGSSRFDTALDPVQSPADRDRPESAAENAAESSAAEPPSPPPALASKTPASNTPASKTPASKTPTGLDLARLSIDDVGRLYWDGKPVEVRRRLTLSRAQVVGTSIIGVLVLVTALGAAVQGTAAAHEWACSRGLIETYCSGARLFDLPT